MKRASGVLMHISSLWGEYSIGSFGREAKKFVDFLSDGGFTYWQVLPFCMADESNSPYKSFSAFGGNPFFIDLPTLHEKGLLTEAELESAKQKTPYVCEYDRLRKERMSLLALAASRAGIALTADVKDFMDNHKPLREAATFLALLDENSGEPWQKWKIQAPTEENLFFHEFLQYEFFTEWLQIKSYANQKGIKIIGDVPIYVALDSADVWANSEQFQLDKRKMPTSVAGVPPDYFCADGQLWGNPLYNWKYMKSDNYSWWRERIRHMLTLFDGVRIDHFRGLESYWSVPAGAKTAKEGKWVKGPGRALINAIREEAGDKLIIAEDLGDITKEVVSLVNYSGFPGMRVFQFAFLGDRSTPHLPHNYPKNCVAYTGTHDNNTLLGHVWEIDGNQRDEVFDYCNCPHNDWSGACEMIIKTMMASHADTVIFPIQDIFVYGSDTRMNTPGTVTNNWQYRITEDQLRRVSCNKFRYLNMLYGR